jgi:hypothetical protein
MIDIDNAEALHIVHVAGLSPGDLIAASALALKKSAAIMAMIFISYTTLLTDSPDADSGLSCGR